MAINDWNTANAQRYYPFRVNTNAKDVDTSEILDAHFFIINPSSNIHPDVWLDSKDTLPNSRKYIFKNSDNDTLEFTVPNSTEVQCIWSQSSRWNGFCVFGPSIKD